MGDGAKAQRREQLKRWSGSCTDQEPAVPRRRWRGEEEEEEGDEDEGEAVLEGRLRDGDGPVRKKKIKRRRRVRFERTAEFLAVCASGDTEEAKEMLREARQKSSGENVKDNVVNCANADGITALHQACIDGSVEVVTFLLSQGANVNQVDNEGWTPLHVAASCGNMEITEYLLKHGAALSSVNCDGDVPLDIAEDEAMEALLQAHTRKQGVDLETAKRLEEELIMRDARSWLTDGLPADLCHPRTGATPLHVAAAKGYLEAIKLLCQCGLDVSAKDWDGWTPLHAAAHWCQREACSLLAEQLCDMEARSNGGQTPFDVADESLVAFLEELSQRQANWRTEQAINDKQNAQAASNGNAANKRRRSSVCRMSSREKMSVQDQSKERGVSGGLELNEDRESSPGKTHLPKGSTISSPDTESVTTSTVSPADKTPEEKEAEEKDQEQERHTARVPPTLQRLDSTGESPSGSGDGKKFQAPVRDEESESQRKARSRLMRQSRRSTQGVTLTDLKEAERTISRTTEPQRTLQPVSPVVTVTPAERDTDTEQIKSSGSEGDSKLAVRDRRRARKERRSTGIASLLGETEDLDVNIPAKEDSTKSAPQPEDTKLSLSLDFRKLYVDVLKENTTLKEKLQETQLQLSESKVELERLRQNQENGCERPALLELERFEKKALQRKASELEDELKILVDLRADNQRLKDENAALIRVISKLSR
ncbi:protein phosphatase 1 regulatory subunit 12C-like isoform X1 [Astyanax mexicanus]|uniref:Protein phosphatase 1 regulatory subunit n=1 Tax=Astyanax mexicanus TaxID=7994 RepID=A0A8B9JHD4_ASTMX|nr:protein phosphatase 1 regulatory subunit 12C-like isoform X1 [Astyanax mexicanus]